MLNLRLIYSCVLILVITTGTFGQNIPDECANATSTMSDIDNSTYGSFANDQADEIIVFKNVNLGCPDNSTYESCNFTINAAVICFMSNVSLLYPSLMLNANKIYISNSSISASGTIQGGAGANTYMPECGLSYAGSGGFCKTSQPQSAQYTDFFTYGSHDTLWNDTNTSLTFGTGLPQGNFNGGGRIVLLAEQSLQVLWSNITSQGQCTSNATIVPSNMTVVPPRSGTGGYIFIGHHNESGLIDLARTTFDISGGAACNNGNNSQILEGSSGRILFDADVNITALKLILNPESTPPSLCQQGATGTAYNFRSKTLLVNNTHRFNTASPFKYTRISQDLNVSNIIVSGEVQMLSIALKEITIQTQNLTISNSASWRFQYTQKINNKLNIVASDRVVLDDGNLKMMHVSGVARIECNSFESYGNSSLWASKLYIITPWEDTTSQIRIGGIFNSLEPWNPLLAIYLYTPKLVIEDEALLTASYINIIADTAEHSGTSEITANLTTCKNYQKMIVYNPMLESLKNHNSTDSTFNLSYVFSNILDKEVSDPPTHEDFTRFAGILSTNYTLLYLARSNISLTENATINAARVGVFANLLELDSGATISANGKGCGSDYGMSPGVKDLQLAPYCGGGGGSYGGVGGVGISNEETTDASACKLLRSYPYGSSSNPIFEGSGGSSSDHCKGGSAGGVVILGAYSMGIDGMVSSSGQEASTIFLTPSQPGCGAGSGGSVQVHTFRKMTGSGFIEANGGNYLANGGAGGAGRILIDYYGWFTNNTIEENVFNGTISAKIGGNEEAGWRYAQGTIHSNPCYPGYYGYFCLPCKVGTYKNDFSNNDCLPCENQPEGYEWGNGPWNGSSYLCKYNCREFKVQNGEKVICLSYLQYYKSYIKTIPGVVVFIFFIVVITALVINKNASREKKQTRRFLERSRTKLPKTITDKDYIDNVKKSSLKRDFVMEDLPYHMSRIYMQGSNNTVQSWFLSGETPVTLHDKIDEDRFAEFVKEINNLCVWSNAEIIFLSLVEILYLPLYSWILGWKKKKILVKLQDYISDSKSNIWKDMRARELSYTIKISSSADFSLAYMDFLNYDISVLEWENTTKFPISIILSGEGNFLAPYQINTLDPLVRSVSLSLKALVSIEMKDDYELENKEDLTKENQDVRTMEFFLITFNNLIREIDHSAPKMHFIDTMRKVLSYIRRANVEFFNSFKIEVDLLVLQCEVLRDNSSGVSSTSYSLNLLDANLDTILIHFRKMKLYSDCHDVQFSINFSQGDEVFLSKHTMAQQTEDENADELYADDYEEMSYLRDKKSARLQKTDRDTEELMELRQKLLKKIETRRAKVQVTESETQSIPVNLQRNLHSEKWKQLMVIMRYFQMFRYFFMGFRPKKFDKHMLTAVVFVLVTVDLFSLLYVISDIEKYYLVFFLPYIFSPISPILGVLTLILSSRYRIGVYFLMFNAMSILNFALRYFQYDVINTSFVLLVKGLIAVFGCHYISHLENLNSINDFDKILE